MHFFEQLFRTNRIYWHGSEFKFDKFKASSDSTAVEKVVFLSTSQEFAINFVFYRKNPSLYMCKLAKPLNLFNIASNHDKQKMLRYLKTEEEKEEFSKIYEDFSDGSLTWRRWDIMEKREYLIAYKELGYDGFTTSERRLRAETGSKFYENIAIFDPENIVILKRFDLESAS
jgi:hypothetical protein